MIDQNQINFAPPSSKFDSLYSSEYRYLCFYGGRYGMKDWCCTDAIIYYTRTFRTRVMICRETMESIEVSNKQLIEDTIYRRGLELEYDIQKMIITHKKTGSIIRFRGLKEDRAGSIKSMEGIDICWVNEAQDVSRKSMDYLIPTIRKSGSVVWFTWNPNNMIDPVHNDFIINEPPPNTYVAKVGWQDNPFMTPEMDQARLHMKKLDPDRYDHHWEGVPLGDEEAFIKLSLIRSAINRTVTYIDTPIICGLDVGYAKDFAVLAIRKGNKILNLYKWKVKDPVKLSQLVTEKVLEHSGKVLFVDYVGVGWGIWGMLQKNLGQACRVLKFNGGWKSPDDSCKDWNAYTWDKFKKWLPEGQIPNDQGLVNKTSTRQYSYTNKTQLVLESKEHMRKRGLDSPDETDACCMTFAPVDLEEPKRYDEIDEVFCG